MDIEKTIQFMLEQQARFDAQFNARLDAQQARFEEQAARVEEQIFRTEEQISRTEEQISRINEVLHALATAQERTNAIVATLAERHVELAQSHKRLAEAHERLSEAQGTTERSLNALISTVERHIANHL
jgi:hypothetical protein